MTDLLTPPSSGDGSGGGPLAPVTDLLTPVTDLVRRRPATMAVASVVC